MIRIFAEPLPKTVGRCLFRVSDALKRYAPQGVEFVTDQSQPHDLHILQAWCPECRGFLTGKPYALIMHEYVPDILPNAVMVASWIPDMMDGERFLPMPLGAEPSVFFREEGVRPLYTTMTTGYIASSELIQEVYQATLAVGGEMVHVGGNCVQGRWLTTYEGISDSAMRRLYNQSRYVSALRSRLGYEIGGVEALFCGTRPLVFPRRDQDVYRRWAITVPETDPATLVRLLTEILRRPPTPLSPEEHAEVVASLSWEPIARAFWKRLLELL
jgi:hypothetical protein